jgi:uncharacterized protein (DUF58 family)
MLRSAAAGAALTPYAELLDALVGLVWPSAARVRAGDPGSHRSMRLGRSPEFTEYRAYRPGDDLRRLDWKLYGRTDRLFLRIADDHASLQTSIVLDASASMAFPEEGQGKWQHASAIAIGLSAVAINDGDAVGIVATDGQGERVVPPRRRRDILHDAAVLLNGIAPSGSPDLAATIRRLQSPPRLVVLSDFLGDAERALPELAVAAAAGSEVVVVHVVADEELNPPKHSFLAEDPELPTLRRAMSDANRGAYDSAFASWRETIASQCHAMHANYAMTVTTESVRDVVRRIVAGHVAQFQRSTP